MLRLLLPLLLLVPPGCEPGPGPNESRGAGLEEGDYIVVLQADAPSQTEARDAERTLGVTLRHVYRHAFKGFSFHGSASAAEALQQDPHVRFVGRDGVVEAVAQSIPTGIDRIDADLNPRSNIDGVDERVPVNVAIIDTGIDTDHPDLNVVGGVDCTFSGTFEDGHGHGSHVGGTVAALDNDIGVVGVAPGANLYAVRVLNASGSGTWSGVACGIDWVAGTRRDDDPANDIAVANMSLGGWGTDDGNCGASNGDVMHAAICGAVSAGVVFVVAAGNSNVDAASFVPAAYDEVITVSAVDDANGQPDATDALAWFSNWGADVDVAAPGVNIYSSYLGGGYTTMSGTSMASPHETGAVALYIAQYGPAMDADGVAAIRAEVARADGAFAVPQASERGFTGDRDAYAEPMANVAPRDGGPTCGDARCDLGETCQGCPADCGPCPPLCGDGACDPDESCDSCPADCGPCPRLCGDGACDPGESCDSCPTDCGPCPPRCGDTVCDPGETCDSCAADCGVCPPLCGDGACDGGEDCRSCPDDCGACPPSCGDAACDPDETCESCPADCGACPPVCGDGACNPREDCHTCVADCGECLPCAHDLCETGDGLDSACDPCAGEVCGIDSYCCASSWDTTCVIEVSTVCAQSCTPGLTIYLTIPRSTYAEGTIVPITATVLDAEAPVSLARVRFTLTRPDGHRVRKDLTTGSSGQVTWRYSAGRRARGGHAVSARVSFGGASANSATITFTVP